MLANDPGLAPHLADRLLTRPSLRHPWAFVDSPEIDLPADSAMPVELVRA